MNIWFVMVAFLLLFSALVMMVLAKYVLSPQSFLLSDEIPARLKKKKRTVSPSEQWNERWQRAGFSASSVVNVSLFLLLLVAAVSGFMLGNWLGAIVALGLCLSVFVLMAQWRRAQIRRKILQQLPTFLDQVNRRMQVGISLQRAIEQSTQNTPKPLNDILERVNQRRHLGIELQDAFYKEWRITGVESFQLLSSIFNVNARFGGSINDSLDSIVLLLRQQDTSRRELSSMTGETRITAYVMGISPLLVVGYMLSNNSTMLLDMWEGDSGRMLLLFAIGLEVVGILLIWRMLRSL